jgi:hypothetical protein
MVEFMKVGRYLISGRLMSLLLRRCLTVLTFPEMFGARFKVYYYYYYLENGVLYCVSSGVSVYMCTTYMFRNINWMKSVLTQVYKLRITPDTEHDATILQESDIFIQIHTWQRLIDVLELH